MKIKLMADGTLILELNKHELDAQIQLLKMFKVEDKQHAFDLDCTLNILQWNRICKK